MDTDPSWWWNTSANVVEYKPSVEFLNPATGDWADYPVIWDNDHNTQALGAGADRPQNNIPPTPPATKGTSTMAATTARNGDTVGLTETFPQMTKIRIKAKWTSTGGPPDVDNAAVDNNQVALHFTFKTWFEA